MLDLSQEALRESKLVVVERYYVLPVKSIDKGVVEARGRLNLRQRLISGFMAVVGQQFILDARYRVLRNRNDDKSVHQYFGGYTNIFSHLEVATNHAILLKQYYPRIDRAVFHDKFDSKSLKTETVLDGIY